MLSEEASEVKDYLTLHTNSTRKDVKETALTLAKESAQHTESLQELTGTIGEPWHKTESGGMVGNLVFGVAGVGYLVGELLEHFFFGN